MKIGILSDTHGDVGRTQLAIRALKARGVQAVIHCGDIGTERILFELSAAFEGVPVHAVLGNTDSHAEDVIEYPESAGVKVAGRFLELELDGRRIAVLHGDDAHRLKQAKESGAYDLVLLGHSHVASDRRIGRTRVINPGAVFRAVPHTVAVLDLRTGHLESIVL